ncbi:MAG TPA: hypothetical protein VE439_11625, partial [Anaerolineae bacterium]|nr:hypothetical protein [Anaerolineae bacterium]
MKKPFRFALVLLLSALAIVLIISLSGCPTVVKRPQPRPKSDTETVTDQVEAFGKQLQKVSLLAPKDEVAKSMRDNYGDYVSPNLLAKWMDNPPSAPGRLTSSPWPDRINIQNTKKLSDNAYEVKGEIIYITSVEKTRGGVAARQPITLTVRKIGNRWLIDAVTLGAYETANALIYRNTQYGFTFTLPKSWKGF